MSPSSVFSSGKSALITGGASGIGLAVAQLCCKYKMRVALVDWNAETLNRAKGNIESSGASSENVETYQVDVSKSEQWAELKSKVIQKFGNVDLLMLNAGVAARGSWGDDEYFQKIMATNLFGVINGLNAFVQDMQQRATPDNPAAIVITGSKQGITNPPGNPAYNASKAAVKTLAEHLDYDLRASHVSVHLLIPGWTFTGLAGNAPGSGAEKPAGAWWPEQVAEYLYDKMEQGKFYVLCPDNEVTAEMDAMRMQWAVGDVVEGRPPLTRWREEWKEEAKKWMEREKH